MSTRRPSFVLFITDQHRADYLGCYGHPSLKTPHIDAMAANGVCYDRFYVNSPVCMPNRASLMTCRTPSSHGVRSNGIPLSQRHVTFVELLREAGYETALIGKSHLQNFSGMPPITKIPEAREGFFAPKRELREAVKHDLSTPDYQYEEPDFWSSEQPTAKTPFYGFDHVELVTGHGDSVGGDYKKWLLDRAPEAEKMIGRENQISHPYVCPQAVRTSIPEELYSTTYIAERAEAWIKDRADNEKPFFLMVSWPDPHHPFNPPGKYWDMYLPENMPVPKAFQVQGWEPPPHVQFVFEARDQGEANLQGMNTIGCSIREAQEAQALTCGMITMIDDAVGRIQDALKASGVSENTITMFTSDHGDHLGDHRLLFKGGEQYEQLLRVPFIWSDPEGIQGERSEGLTQTCDIGTTILERARVERAYGMQGLDVTNQHRKNAFIQYTHQKNMQGLNIPPHIHTLRNDRYRLSVIEGVEWGELYDLEKDPGELSNVWHEAKYQEVKIRLLEDLIQAQLSSEDISPAPTGRA